LLLLHRTDDGTKVFWVMRMMMMLLLLLLSLLPLDVALCRLSRVTSSRFDSIW